MLIFFFVCCCYHFVFCFSRFEQQQSNVSEKNNSYAILIHISWIIWTVCMFACGWMVDGLYLSNCMFFPIFFYFVGNKLPVYISISAENSFAHFQNDTHLVLQLHFRCWKIIISDDRVPNTGRANRMHPDFRELDIQTNYKIKNLKHFD